MWKQALVILVLCFAAPVSAQLDVVDIDFVSDDGAIRFSYPSEWTMESESTTFNQTY